MGRRLTPQERLDRAITEREFQDQVIQLAHLFKWRVAHFRPAMTTQGWRTPVQADGAGFPDLLMTRGTRVVVAELKRELAKTSQDQEAWLAAFAAAGVRAVVWRPSDLRTGAIQRVLGHTGILALSGLAP
jgi:hypothetical protein